MTQTSRDEAERKRKLAEVFGDVLPRDDSQTSATT